MLYLFHGIWCEKFMAGRCFQCAEQFGFFKREYDCENCGKIFCSKCTSNSLVIPSKGKKAVRVCNDCYKKLTTQKQQTSNNANGGRVTPNERNNQIRCSESKPSSVADNPMPFDPDEDIQRRLKKLRENDNTITQVDINAKFENVTGRVPSSEITSDIHTFGPKKTEAEQMSDLLKQMQDECNIDDKAGYKTVHSDIDTGDIERRLDKLKGREPMSSGAPSYDYDSDDEAEFRRRYIQQAIAESFMDDRIRKEGHGELLERAEQKVASKEHEMPTDPDELPWCCICNEDASLRCHGCDDDLYCRRCFREGHGRGEYKHHTISAYKPPRKPP